MYGLLNFLKLFSLSNVILNKCFQNECLVFMKLFGEYNIGHIYSFHNWLCFQKHLLKCNNIRLVEWCKTGISDLHESKNRCLSFRVLFLFVLTLVYPLIWNGVSRLTVIQMTFSLVVGSSEWINTHYYLSPNIKIVSF